MTLPKMTREAFAKLTGVTEPAVRQWIIDGMPAVRTGNAGNSGYAIDAPLALEWLFKRRIESAVRAERRRMVRRYNLVPELDDDEIAKLRETLTHSLANWK